MKTMKRSPQVTSVEVVGERTVRVGFNDGVVLDHDMTRLIDRGGIWAPLTDPGYFAQVRVDSEINTVTWPNGADICPDILHGDVQPE